MIKLDVKPYCHDCLCFKPTVTHIEYSRNLVVTCENAFACEHVADFVRKDINERVKKEVSKK